MELKTYQKRQMEVRQQKAEEEFKKELEHATKTQALLDQGEKQFLSYAEQCIAEWERQGKNVKPLIMELKNQKKTKFI